MWLQNIFENNYVSTSICKRNYCWKQHSRSAAWPFCSADDPMAQPPHGTEVFVGGVPRTATEEQLSVFASEVGEVHGITLLREPQNPEHNRG